MKGTKEMRMGWHQSLKPRKVVNRMHQQLKTKKLASIKQIRFSEPGLVTRAKDQVGSDITLMNFSLLLSREQELSSTS